MDVRWEELRRGREATLVKTASLEASSELPEAWRDSALAEGRTGDYSQFQDVTLEVCIQAAVTGGPSDSLITAERPDDLDGLLGGLCPRQEIEAACDEHVSDQDTEVALLPIPLDPGFLVGDRSGEAQSIVDELHASRASGDRFGNSFVRDVGDITARSCSENRQHTGDHRPSLELGFESRVQIGRFHVRYRVVCGPARCRGFVHYCRLVRAKPKNFGNAQRLVCMITTDRNDDLRVIRLDRPDRRNALTWNGLAALEEAVQGATESVLYLHGAGPAFCAGADLDLVKSLDGDDVSEFIEAGQSVANALASYEGVVVAGIDGAARGGGVELALACDIRVATPDATLAESGVAHGLYGAWGGSVRLPRIVGEGNALDLSLSGRAVTAEEALRMGLVSRVTETPRAVADGLCDNDARAMELIKKRIRDTSSQVEQERRERDVFKMLHELQFEEKGP